jgi:thiamine-phosphate pyrophosphorylase
MPARTARSSTSCAPRSTAATPAVQLRWKEAGAREMAALARALLRETRAAGALLFVNDRLDVALAVGADGVHVGQADLPAAPPRQRRASRGS